MDSDLTRLKLAFTLHMVEQIFGADAEVVASERAFLHDTFPPDLLATCGFRDASGQPTAAYEEARDSALFELPDRLTPGEKMQVLEVLVDATAADGVLNAEETLALAHAATLLGLPDVAWQEHMQELEAAGRVRRDGCAV